MVSAVTCRISFGQASDPHQSTHPPHTHHKPLTLANHKPPLWHKWWPHQFVFFWWQSINQTQNIYRIYHRSFNRLNISTAFWKRIWLQVCAVNFNWKNYSRIGVNTMWYRWALVRLRNFTNWTPWQRGTGAKILNVHIFLSKHSPVIWPIFEICTAMNLILKWHAQLKDVFGRSQ